jgi:branched-chain amino acid transport system ATP-binding protein
MIEIDNLTVRFGGITPLDDLTIRFPSGTCGLIGPNGAGKSTLFNVLSGFVTPAEGSVRTDDLDLLELAPHRRAQWGLRRTFQTEQLVGELTVFENVALMHEHAGHPRSEREDDVTQALETAGVRSGPNRRAEQVDSGERRLVEVARALVGSPRVILLDEPAAGLPESESEHLSEVISSIPSKYGATVILVEHDMSLVSSCCDNSVVIDFGKVIASGPTDEVLRDENVTRAYLGTEEVAV